MMLTTTVYAQTPGQTAPEAPNPTMDVIFQFLPIILIGVVFYFLMLRPQQVRQKELKGKIDALVRGDEVVTAAGIIGKVSRLIDKDEVIVTIADGVDVRVVRSTLALVLKPEDKAV